LLSMNQERRSSTFEHIPPHLEVTFSDTAEKQLKKDRYRREQIEKRLGRLSLTTDRRITGITPFTSRVNGNPPNSGYILVDKRMVKVYPNGHNGVIVYDISPVG